jgi:hypothetical protein
MLGWSLLPFARKFCPFVLASEPIDRIRGFSAELGCASVEIIRKQVASRD